MTRAQGEAIIRELGAIRLLLQNGGPVRDPGLGPSATPHDVKMRVNPGWQVMGRADAPVTLVEFADYQCPYCRQFQAETFPQLQKTYIDTGKVRFLAFDFPLGIHEYAFQGAKAALCAGEQSKFWEMRDLLLTESGGLADEALSGYAERLGLNRDLFRSCLKTDQFAQKIRSEVAQARDIGVTGTPTFILGKTQSKEVDGMMLLGVQSYPQLDSLIQGLLGPKP